MVADKQMKPDLTKNLIRHRFNRKKMFKKKKGFYWLIPACSLVDLEKRFGWKLELCLSRNKVKLAEKTCGPWNVTTGLSLTITSALQ